MKIILDANIIFGDFHLTGLIGTLCRSVKITGDFVYIPAVVIDEVINLYRKEIYDYKSKIEKSKTDIKRLTEKDIVNSIDNPIIDTDNLIKKHEEKIKNCQLKCEKAISDCNKLLGKEVGEKLNCEEFIVKEVEEYRWKFKKAICKLGIKTIEYPLISHQELVKRDLAQKKPFQPSGKGYRDALIWESIKSECEKLLSLPLLEAPKIVFITKNSKDFCKCGLLHPDLGEDLVDNGYDEYSVRVVDKIDAFIKEYITIKKKILKDIKNVLNLDRRYKEIDLDREIENRVTEFLLYREFNYEESPFGQEFENPSIVNINSPSSIVTEVRQISEKEVLIEIAVDIYCEFDFFILKSNVVCMDEDELPYIWDCDWNDHYMGASETTALQLTVTLVVDSSFESILCDEIELTHK